MPRYKVLAEAKYEYTGIEADDEESALEQAIDMFGQCWDGNPIGLFQWKVLEHKKREVMIEKPNR